MTTKEFKSIARLLKEVYAELEKEAIQAGISLLSPEYDQLIFKAREKVLENAGFTLQQYREAKAKVAGFSQADYVESVEQHTTRLEELGDRHIPTQEEITQIAEQVAQKYIVPPVITNQIVKETTIEQPKIIETTKIVKETYDSKPLEEKIQNLRKQLRELKIPEPYNDSKLKEYFENYFAENFEKNINTLDMPNFRKLAMGLQAQIDANVIPTASATTLGGIKVGTRLTITNGVLSADVQSGGGDVVAPATHQASYIPQWNSTPNSKTLVEGLAVPAGGLAGITALNLKLDTTAFSDAGVTGKLITGFTSGAGAVAGTDTILQAINKLDGNIGTKQATLVSGTSIKTINGASILAAGDLTLLTSLSGAVLTDQTAGQTIGLTGARLTKLWATDITVTNAITGSVTGSAGSATTATTATHLAGGSGGTIPYQSAAGTTAMLANGTAGQVLQSNGTTLAPSWVAAGTGNMVLADVQSVTGLKTFDTTKLAVKGSSTGTTAIASANAGATSYTATLKAETGTLAYLTDITGTNSGTNTGDQDLSTLAPKTAPTFATSITGSYLTASEILITDGSKNIVSAPVATYPSLTELTYLKGVTSGIQAQINAKGAGTVTAVSVATANGVSGSSSGGATPALTIALGAITPTTVNALTLASQAVGFTIAGGTTSKTLTVPLDASVSGTNTGDNATNTQYSGLVTNATHTGDATGSGALTVVALNGTNLAALGTGILKNTTTTGVPSIAIAADFPTLNQSTTGSAATLTTTRAIYGNNFDGSAALTGIIASTYGGTGNGFSKFSGATTTEKTYTLPDASTTILTTNALVTSAQGGTGNGFTKFTGATTAEKTYTLPDASTTILTTNYTGALTTGIVKNTTTTGALTIAIAADFPTLNQNTTGSAATLTTTRTIWGQNFNGSANVTGDLALGASSLTLTGSIGATGARATKLWATDIESTNMPTVGGTSLTDTFVNVTGDSMTGALAISAAALPLTSKNTTDSSAVQVLVLEGDRATPANNDYSYISAKMSDSAGNQDEMVRIAFDVIDVTSGSEDSGITISTRVAGTLASKLLITGTEIRSSTALAGTYALGTTGVRFSKLWTVDSESTNMPTVGGTAILSSLTAPQFTTIELGAATDTTLSRVSAGVVAIEGVNILTTAGGTMTGDITLGENTAINLNPAGSADGKYSGICISGTAGETVAFGDLMYLKAADSRWWLTDADASATGGPVMIGMCVVGGNAAASIKILLQGQIRADAKFPALTIGAPAYLGETAGDVQVAIPTGADGIIRVMGFALTADSMYFNPSPEWQITVA